MTLQLILERVYRLLLLREDAARIETLPLAAYRSEGRTTVSCAVGEASRRQRHELRVRPYVVLIPRLICRAYLKHK